ncbi:GroES-like protein [Aspergillus karnatakaensis]|uniref:zinc-binding alcohol dehydrogenase family protein n=1 Tax=Aspergillus karnatakaensis TaxID=1810916 RepID=UPI003CCD4805
MKAIVTNRFLPKRLLSLALGSALGEGAQVKDVPIPTTTEDEVLVKVLAVALNPIDFKGVDFLSPRNSIVGCDYAGEVVKVGTIAGRRWKVGDRIAGFVHGGMYPDVGAFAEYLKVDGELAWKVPEHISLGEAATYGIPAATAMLGLSYLGIPWEDVEAGRDWGNDQPVVFIYSGGSNVGLFAIQLAKRAGYAVVVAASPRSSDLAKRYGADAVYDYKSPTAVAEIQMAYPNITRALDCFSEGGSATFCADILKEGKVVTLLDRGSPKRADVTYTFLMVYTVFGRSFQMMPPIGPVFTAVSSDRDLLRRFYGSLSTLSPDAVRPPPITTSKGGFEDIFEGLKTLRIGDGRGTKLVVEFE